MSLNKLVGFQVGLSDGSTEATTFSITDMDHVGNQREREIYGITSSHQMQFNMEFSIYSIQFEAWRQAMCIQELHKTIKQHVIHFGYPTMHLVSLISVSLR